MHDSAPKLVVPQAAVDRRTIRIHNADTLIMIKNGVSLDAMTPEAMLDLAAAMTLQARRALEMRPKTAEQLAVDSAILLRQGLPFGLTSNPAILDMAKVHAESNRELRRAMPGGIKGTTQFGRPGVAHVPRSSRDPG